MYSGYVSILVKLKSSYQPFHLFLSQNWLKWNYKTAFSTHLNVRQEMHPKCSYYRMFGYLQQYDPVNKTIMYMLHGRKGVQTCR